MKSLVEEHFPAIVKKALEQEHLSGIVTILQQIAKSVDACGCVLWQADPWTELGLNPSEGHLFASASWFEQDIEPLNLKKLPVASEVGRAIETRKTRNVPNLRDSKYAHQDDRINDVMKLTSMCAVPIKFDESKEYPDASISVSRRDVIRPFNKAEQAFVEKIAHLVPSLYRALRNRVSRNLITEINDLLVDSEKNYKTSPDPRDQVHDGLAKICKSVAKAFNCVETSIFLENRLQAPGVYRRYATTYEDWSGARDEYHAVKEHGLTGWVLSEKEPVRIFDLGTFVEDKKKWENEYNGIQWNDSLNIKNQARSLLGYSDEKLELPPLSFMAVPVERDDKLLGVIRCCMPTKPPWVFTDRESRLLGLVASQVSSFWNDWLQHQESNAENESWNHLVHGISELNETVKNSFAHSNLEEDRLYSSILHLAKKVIAGSDMLDIRLHDDSKKELYFAAHDGSAWNKGSKTAREQRMKRRFSTQQEIPEGNKRLIGVQVFKDGRPREVVDAQAEGYVSTTFPETRRILVAPIGYQKKNIGVLDIRGTGDKPFAPYALFIAELLGRQLGLYLSLWKSDKLQQQVFADTWHQLKSPVRHTLARASSLLRRFNNEDVKLFSVAPELAFSLEDRLRKLRGVARKTNKVLMNAGIFTELATNGFLAPAKSKRRLLSDELIKMLIEVSADTVLLLETFRNIRFDIVRNSFSELDLEGRIVLVNSDYLEQALNCIIDNAGKYSFSNTKFVVSGSVIRLERKEYFKILIENRGLAIGADEVPLLNERNYRGQLARVSTGEGSGIGLWVTDHIMRNHGGVLLISPTSTLTGITQVALLFPFEEK